jgi:GNAT superfamily N-acetyltransferase
VPLIDALRHACIAAMQNAGVDQWDEVYPTPQIIEQGCVHGNVFLLLDVERRVLGSVTLDQAQSPEYAAVPWSHTAGPIGVVHRLMIAPERQGQGFAKVLMRAVEEQARRRGYQTIRLDAFLENPAALRLYESLGYHRAGQVQFRKGPFACFEKSLGHAEGPE